MCYEFSQNISKTFFVPDYPEFPKTLGERLRKARLDQGLQIKDVVQHTGISEMSIVNWERHGVKPRRHLLEKLLAFYGV